MNAVIVKMKCCKGCGVTFPIAAFPFKRRTDRKSGYHGARCVACERKKELERHKRRKDLESGPNNGFGGFRHPDRDMPFPEQGMVFRGWRGPVGEWRVRL